MIDLFQNIYLKIVDAQIPIDDLVLVMMLAFALLLLERVIPKLKFINTFLSVAIIVVELFIAFTTIYSWYLPFFIFTIACQVFSLRKRNLVDLWIVAFVLLLMWAMPSKSSFWYEFVKMEFLTMLQVVILLRSSSKSVFKLFNVYLRNFLGALLLLVSFMLMKSGKIEGVYFFEVLVSLLFIAGIFLKTGLFFLSERDEVFMHEKTSDDSDMLWLIFKPFIFVQAFVMLNLFREVSTSVNFIQALLVISSIAAFYYLALLFSGKKRDQSVFYLMIINFLTLIPLGVLLYDRGLDYVVFLLFHMVISHYIAIKYFKRGHGLILLALCSGIPLTGSVLLKQRVFNLLLSSDYYNVFYLIAGIYVMVLLFYFKILNQGVNEEV